LCELGVRTVQGYFLSRPKLLQDLPKSLTLPPVAAGI